MTMFRLICAKNLGWRTYRIDDDAAAHLRASNPAEPAYISIGLNFVGHQRVATPQGF